MKKFIICLISCFSIFTLCSATSTLEDVYLNKFKILVNGENYSPTLPILNYQGRTYLPLNEFGSLTGNDISFVDKTVFIRSNYQELFYLYTYIDDLYDNINNLNEYISHAMDSYYSSYNSPESVKAAKSFLTAFRQSQNNIETILSDKILFVRYCLAQNILTIDEADTLLQKIETISNDFGLTERKITYYLTEELYGENVHSTYSVPLEMTTNINKELLKIKLEISEKFNQ